jgi:outer membrane receptor protein involved in Fe transport
MDNLISFKRLRSGELIYSPRNDAEGRVHGVEFEMSLTDSRVMAWINVACMVAKENNAYDGQGWQYRPTDQRKTVTTVFEYRIADQWVVNLRALYGSGYAYVDDSPGIRGETRLHYPDYKRADVRLSYAFTVEAITAAVFLEITNLFAHRNVYSFTGTLQDPQTPDYNLLLPMIINVGFRLRL